MKIVEKSASYLKKYFGKAFFDYGLLIIAFPMAFLIRLDWPLSINGFFDVIGIFWVAVVAKFIALGIFQPFTATWRQISFYDAKNIIFTVISSTFLWTFFVFLFFQDQIPRSIPILDITLATAFLFSIRFVRRYVYELKISITSKIRRADKPKQTIIIGGGQAAALLLREIRKHPEIGLKPVAILDDDLSKVGQRLSNVPIKGPVNEIVKWVEALNIEEVIIAVANGNHNLHRRAIKLTADINRPLRFRTIPALVDLIADDVKIDRIRDVKVEDLLGRNLVQLDVTSVREFINGQVVLVTGAGGSIGSELVRQVVRYMPQKLVLLGRGENSLYQIEQEIRDKYPELHLEIALCNIQNKHQTSNVFERYKPDIVLHAAAHKHVPLVELNPSEVIFNNILGTRNVVELAKKLKVKSFVNISTDKAVNPTSVMGASKHVAEAIVFEASESSKNTFFVSVRFGNVLGSRGSVIPLFKKQIRMGGPVTVTHPDMIRYFMTIPEAAQLVLQAASFKEQGKLYVLDMGEPVKIYDLAKDLIRLSGLELDKDIEIVFSGIRSGEKLYEELSMASENRIRTESQKIFKVDKTPVNDLESLITELERLAVLGEDAKVREILNEKIVGARLVLNDNSSNSIVS